MLCTLVYFLEKKAVSFFGNVIFSISMGSRTLVQLEMSFRKHVLILISSRRLSILNFKDVFNVYVMLF